ncbi:hypothetical protein K457DRAFT_636419 [Linnemannia elongata AG-77]|uniref:Uncharacterized protein n=1 Tax=Linnemannia elongata AG-77 TaxID=1314771 RepID=A0A197JT27_9FUNG|nr:hypothetical protein K457DRAFT_636419 [Linnemannia elongata AG-77]
MTRPKRDRASARVRVGRSTRRNELVCSHCGTRSFHSHVQKQSFSPLVRFPCCCCCCAGEPPTDLTFVIYPSHAFSFSVLFSFSITPFLPRHSLPRHFPLNTCHNLSLPVPSTHHLSQHHTSPTIGQPPSICSSSSIS